MKLLVHLRYLAIRKESEGFPSSICYLWGLQTLIYITYRERTVLPNNISNLVNLRHLLSDKVVFLLPSIEKPMNLKTISYVVLNDEVVNLQKYFPYIKELTCCTCYDEQNDFKSLTYLEKLKLNSSFGSRVEHITFPETLKKLTLESCGLAWSVMPYTDVAGRCWNTDGQEFRQLKFLKLEALDINQWEASSRSFPSLRQLEITACSSFEEIPLEIGDIPTLELILIKGCRGSVKESVRRIEEEQHDFRNVNLKIHII
ncbi:hypothetical protein Hanom_Chr16g01470641 [Helianthus anomalus]